MRTSSTTILSRTSFLNSSKNQLTLFIPIMFLFFSLQLSNNENISLEPKLFSNYQFNNCYLVSLWWKMVKQEVNKEWNQLLTSESSIWLKSSFLSIEKKIFFQMYYQFQWNDYCFIIECFFQFLSWINHLNGKSLLSWKYQFQPKYWRKDS